MRYVVDRNVVMRRVTVSKDVHAELHHNQTARTNTPYRTLRITQCHLHHSKQLETAHLSCKCPVKNINLADNCR